MDSRWHFEAAETSNDGDAGGSAEEWFLSFFAAATADVDDPGSFVESYLSFFAIAGPDDDDPGSSMEKLTADAQLGPQS